MNARTPSSSSATRIVSVPFRSVSVPEAEGGGPPVNRYAGNTF